ncbi:MAG TPA: primosomal protein N' [Clostridiales bacterium]|jgi:primosomal protein N' (replication factor Y)|nr:primosomal protein N' [Clostridiales bacterium]
MIAEVIVDINHSNVDKVFEYLNPDNIPIGSRVYVPFGRQYIEGFIIGQKQTPDYDFEKLKQIIRPLDEVPVISNEMLALMRFMTERYNLKKVDALRLFIPAQMRGGRIKALTKNYVKVKSGLSKGDIFDIINPRAKSQIELMEYLLSCEEEVESSYINNNFSSAPLRALEQKGLIEIVSKEIKRTPYKDIKAKNEIFSLTSEQLNAYDTIKNARDQIFLLHGVTGSGKTEIYIRCINDCIQNNKTAVLLVPEISLTPQVFSLFKSRFGDNVAILHSGLSTGERYDEWRRILKGEASIVIGARSAIFAPLKDIGIIIIDEEHDPSYISENNPRYFTHEIAEFRRRYNKAVMILGSATPSIESYYLAQSKKVHMIEMPNRINQKPLPKIKIVDMTQELRRGNHGIFSLELIDCMSDALREGDQIILFLNRRGYASYQMCRSCGYVVKCSDCDVSMVFHRAENALKCHYCSKRSHVLKVCSQCGSEHIRQGLYGTQRVTEELEKLFPDVSVLRMDNDTTRTKDAHLKILKDFAEHKAQILLGTQMVTKGHDFSDVTLVGILDADLSLYFSDFRSTERTFQLITQVSGRAGRDQKEGLVILQTYSPRHYVYKFAQNYDYLGFYQKEINIRSVTKYPPFSTIIRILACSEIEENAIEVLKNIYDEIKPLTERDRERFLYLKAMKSPIKRIKKKYRVQILMRLTADGVDKNLAEIYNIINKNNDKKDVLVYSEINPQDLS